MKKIILILMMIIMGGCSHDAQTEPEGLSITLDDRIVTLYQVFNVDDYTPYDDYFEQVSCGYEGMDKIFTYQDYILYTIPDENGQDRILEIQIINDGETMNQLSLQSTMDEIESIYGEATEQYDTVYRFVEGTSVLVVTLDGDTIVALSLLYEA